MSKGLWHDVGDVFAEQALNADSTELSALAIELSAEAYAIAWQGCTCAACRPKQ